MYPIAHAVRHVDYYLNGEREDERILSETFLGDVARSMYFTLRRCGIIDPILVRILDEVKEMREKGRD